MKTGMIVNVLHLLLPLAQFTSTRKVCAEKSHDAIDDLSPS